MSWQDTSRGELGFKIERSTDGRHFKQIAQVLPNTTVYRNTGLFPGTKYYYRVRAFGPAGDSWCMGIARARTPEPECALAVNDCSGYFYSPTPVGLTGAVAIAVGGNCRLALRADGSVVQWNNYQVTPSQPTNLSSVVAISANYYHALALKSDGTVVQWALSPYFNVAEPPAGLAGVQAISAGSFHSLALNRNGTVVGWGENSYGQATPPANLSGVVAISAGAYHSLALKSDGTVVGWGDNSTGAATPPTNLTRVVAIAAGSYHSLALKNDGSVVSWGGGPGNQLPPTNLHDVTSISAGTYISVALKRDGRVVTWADYPYGTFSLLTNLNGIVAIPEHGDTGLALSTTPNPPPEVVAQVIATNVVRLFWRDDSAGQVAVRIERARDVTGYFEASNWTQIGDVGRGITHFTDSHATNNGSYYYRLKAFNQCNVSLESQWTYVTVAPPVEKPTLYAGVNIDSVYLAWYAGSVGVTNVKIERALDVASNPGTWTEIISTNTSAFSFPLTDAGLAVNTTYWYRARVVNGLGESPYSDPVSVTILPPSAPRSLFAQIGSTNQIILSWYGAIDHDGVKLERSTNAVDWIEIATITNSSYQAEFVDSTVNANTTYWYRVRVFNKLGDSPYSAEVSVSVVPPSAPTITSVSPFADTMCVYWSQGDYAGWIERFELERSTNATGSPLPGGRVIPGTWELIAIITNNYESNTYFDYTDKNLSPGGSYSYRVRSSNWVGVSPYSTPVSATIVPPATPYSLRVEIGPTNFVNLSWYAGNRTDQDGFKIERALDAGGRPENWTEIGIVGITNASYGTYADAGTTPNLTYWYRVRAFNVVGDSLYCDPAVLNIVSPQTPTLSASAFINQVQLNWQVASEGVIGFRLERAADAGGNPGAWTEIARFNPTTSYYGSAYGSFTDTNRTANATYWYRVIGFNWVGDSPYSSPVSVTIVPPAAPVNLTVRVGTTNQADLSWYRKGEEAGFQIERAPDTSGSPGIWTQIAMVYATNLDWFFPSYSDPAVVRSNSYWYRIRSFNIIGVSSNSSPANVNIVPPPAPTGLQATHFANRVDLSWSTAFYDYGHVDGCEVERAMDANGVPGTWTKIASLPSDSTTYSDRGLTGNTTYWYRVRAYNWVGASDFSPLTTVTVTPPAAPVNLVATIGFLNRVNLTWYVNYAPEQDGFKLERALDESGIPGDWSEVATVAATNFYTANYADTNVTTNAVYWYQVKAFNATGISTNSTPVKVNIAPPAAPWSLNAQPFANEIRLSWYGSYSDYGVVSGYKIERALDVSGNPGAWTQIAILEVPHDDFNQGTYPDRNRTPNTTYWYRVRAYNWVGDGDYTAPVYATIVPPVAPYFLSARVADTNQVDLTWYVDYADQSGFIVERSPDADGNPGPWTQIATLYATNNWDVQFTDTNVTANTTNWYRVQTFNAAGVSDYTDPARVDIVPPRAPQSLSASPFANRVTLYWTIVDYIKSGGCNVERALDVSGTPGAWEHIATTTDTSLVDENLLAGATYWYRVKAFNWVGASDYSDPVFVTIIPPQPPANLTATIGTTNRVNLSWYPLWPYDQDGYLLEKAADVGGSPGEWFEIANIASTYSSTTYFTDTNVTANSINWYRVRAFNMVGVSDYSLATRIEVVPPLAPASLSASPFANRVNLSWYGSYGSYGVVDGFSIERAPDADGSPGSWAQIGMQPAGYYSYSYFTDSNLTANATYWYRVRAFNWIGNGPYSTPVSVTIMSPSAPSRLAATIGNTNQVQVRWDAGYPYDQDGFLLERAPDSAGTPGQWTQIALVPGNNTYSSGFTDTNIAVNTTNWYRVRSFNALGTSSYSAAARIAILPPPASSFLYATPFVNRVMLRWSSAYSPYGVIDGYKLERADDVAGAPGTWVQIESLNGIYTTSFTDSNRSAGATYWYRVRAYNWVGNGDYSLTAKATIVPPLPPSRLAASVGDTNQARVAWQMDTQPEQDGFIIQKAPDTNGIPGTWAQIAIIGATNTSYGSFIDSNVMAFTTNWYRVRAFNVVGISTNGTLATCAVLPPPAPLTFYAYVNYNQVYLSWYDYDAFYGWVNGVKLERAVDVGGSPDGWTQIAAIGSNTDYYTDTNCAANTTYWYRIRAYNWIGDGAYSTPVRVTVGSDTARGGLPMGTPAAQPPVVPARITTPAPRITSIAVIGNDVVISWSATGGSTNIVEVASTLGGQFTNLSPSLMLTGSGDVTTNYLDIGALTNTASRFYRIRPVR